MVHGMSHIVLQAPSVDALERTVAFYNLLGFEKRMDQSNESSEEERQVWLELKTTAPCKTASDIVILLKLNAETILHDPPAVDMDWSLQDFILVLTVDQLNSMESKLKDKNVPLQPSSSTLYALDPLHHLIACTNNPLPLQPKVCADNSGRRKKIAILTSGGDAPAMNACVRAVVRYGLTKGCDIYAIYEGYQGLVDGGKYIHKMNWKSVQGWLSVGGTTIGTARCMDFKTREGRQKAAENLIKHGIDSLIVCGGDGSLTGADVFRSEWSDLLDDLKVANRITEAEAAACAYLTIVGLVGSIDNDMSTTDVTIGAITALHRICEAVDSVNTTALSHSRAFVIEVMGRHCGWLALMAGIATGADFVLIPEQPPEEEDWESKMCSVARRHRELGKRKTVIIVAEGAIDRNLKHITAEYIKDVLTDRLGLDTRVTILGHTQRGGSPAAADRIIATIQGIEAVNAVLDATPDTPSPMIGLSKNRVMRTPLMHAVAVTHQVAEAIAAKDFERAVRLRDPTFAEEQESYIATTILDDQSIVVPPHQRMKIAILHVGAPAGGMNAATRTAVRYALNRGHTPMIVYNGFRGLERGAMENVGWMDVDGWTSRGGSELGTNRAVPGVDVDMGTITYQIQQHEIQAIMVIGGFEAYMSLIKLREARYEYPSLCIPMCILPATISNNVPGADFSLGCDTSLNAIVESCDAISLSAQSSRRRVFVVEVQGGNSGFLAVEGGLAVGATMIYIPEEGITLTQLQRDIGQLKALYADDDPERSEGRVILRTEGVSDTYTTEVISNILCDEGHGVFDSRTAVLGHIQQGGTPSPLDRLRATRMAKYGIDFCEKHASCALNQAHINGQPPPAELTLDEASVAVVGIEGQVICETPVADLISSTNIKLRKPQAAWWQDRRQLVDLLSGRGLFEAQE